MDILIERIEKAAAEDRSVTFVVGGQETVVSWAEMNRRAQSMAAELQSRGVSPGDRVAILSTTSFELVVALQAIWLTGATVVVLPLPMRMGSLPDFIAATKNRVELAECSTVLVSPQMAAFAGRGDDQVAHLDLVELAGTDRDPEELVRPEYRPEDLAILQFTSGSTSAPKGVMLPNHVISANLSAMVETVEIDLETDVLVSWLPLYHDMGLIGCCVLPMAEGMNLVLGSPQDFLGSPQCWMEWISTYSGTLTAGPNFSYVLAARGLRRPGTSLDLSSLRLALNGAEPVDPQCVRDFISAGQPHQLNPAAVFPAFGMAELAIAGSFPRPLSGLVVDVVDGETLEMKGQAVPAKPDASGAREMVMLGSAVPGLRFRIVDPVTGEHCPDRSVGELQISGTSVTSGYYNRADATEELFDGEWLLTGDLGYLVDGQLVLCGRIKDLIIVGGRNIYPQDIERSVGQLDGVRAGNVAAFATTDSKGKEGIVVVAETRVPVTDELAASVKQTVLASVGAPCREVVFVKPGSLPKTSSGKLQRSQCASMYQQESLQLAG